MARDAEAGARLRSGRSSASLDPHRSTVRRSSAPRRNTVAKPMPTPAREANTPRNSRVSRPAPAQPKGSRTPWTTRAWETASAFSEHVLTQTQERVRRLLDYKVPSPSTWVLRTLGLLVVVLAGLGVAHFVRRHLTTAPAFAIDKIDVQGVSRIERDELLQAAGLALGQNIFAQPPEQLEQRLARHPWVIGVRVERELPSRLTISVRERDPVALMVVEACQPSANKPERELAEDEAGCEEASSLYLISEDATMFKRLGGRDPVDLPVITGLARPRMAADPELAPRVLNTAVGLMRAYRDSGLWQQFPLGEIHLEANDGYSLYVGEELTYVRLGSAPFDAKLRRMKKVFERLSAEHARAEYVYLDNEQRPDRVAVRLR